MQRIKLIVILLAAAIAVSCGVVAPTPTPTIFVPTGALIPADKTLTPVMSEVKLKEPTPTLKPVVATVIAAFEGCNGNSIYDSRLERMLSLDGLWTAMVCENDGIHTRVSRIDQSVIWKLPIIEPKIISPDPNWIPMRWYLLIFEK